MLPVIVLSCSRLEQDQRLARELGAAQHQVKPIDLNGTVQFVRKLHVFLGTCRSVQAQADSSP